MIHVTLKHPVRVRLWKENSPGLEPALEGRSVRVVAFDADESTATGPGDEKGWGCYDVTAIFLHPDNGDPQNPLSWNGSFELPDDTIHAIAHDERGG